MKPGDFVLEILKKAPNDRRIIVLIRHSKRDPFGDMPEHLRNGVAITPEGILMARKFGHALGTIFPGKPLQLGHTIATRCRMTAESIREGYPHDHPSRILGCEPAIKSPVLHLERYVATRNELGWRELMRRWLDSELPADTFANPHQYSDEIIRNLFACTDSENGALLVVIAHDITLFPIISRVFGVKVTAIEFLNGIVITAGTEAVA
ncbi:MAG: histidine phosphatase family protein [Methanomicrobiales archaeon]